MIRQDWDTSRKRFETWWNGSALDRVLLQVYAPKKEVSPNAPPAVQPRSLEDQWFGIDYRLDAFEHQLAHTHYAGDAFPFFETHIGPGTMSLYLGAKPELQPNTVWYGKCWDDIATAPEPSIDEDNKYWQFSQKFAAAAVERLHGRALVAFPDLIENLDTLSSLLGNHELLFHLVDAPDHVHRLQRPLVDIYAHYHTRLYEIIRDETGGSCFSAFQTWGPGRVAKLQCDFSAMISAKMFEEFVAPYLAEQCAKLDHTVYHLDGECALQHLDILLSIKDLNAIQWTPGAGKPGPADACYHWLWKKVRAAGKSCMVRGATPEQAREMVETFGPEGLDITVGMPTQDEAEELVRQAMTWRKQTAD